MTDVEGRPHHTPRGSRTRLSGLPTGHRARPHTTGRARMPCPSLHRISDGQPTPPWLPAESPSLVFPSIVATAFTACSRPCREYAASAVEMFFLKAVWLSLSSASYNGDGHTAFFVHCRGERSVFLGGSNHSPKNSITSFIRVAMLLPSGAFDCSHCKGISCPSCGLGIHAALVKIFLSEQALRAYFPNSST